MKNKPTLEEVKNVFENAKKVIDWNNDKCKITFKNLEQTKDGSVIQDFGGKNWCVLYSPKHGYAKILTYKNPKTTTLFLKQEAGEKYIMVNDVKYVPEPEFQITKDFIKLIHEFSPPTIKVAIELEFPKAFEEDKVELEVGRWYKGTAEFKSLIYITSLSKERNSEREYNRIAYYGFINNVFKEYAIANLEHEKSLVLATHQEVEEALRNEAVRRGYKNGNHKCLDLPNFTETTCEESFLFDEKGLWFGTKNKANLIFKDGIWATIIPTKTRQEAEKELNCKIVD